MVLKQEQLDEWYRQSYLYKVGIFSIPISQMEKLDPRHKSLNLKLYPLILSSVNLPPSHTILLNRKETNRYEITAFQYKLANFVFNMSTGKNDFSWRSLANVKSLDILHCLLKEVSMFAVKNCPKLQQTYRRERE